MDIKEIKVGNRSYTIKDALGREQIRDISTMIPRISRGDISAFLADEWMPNTEYVEGSFCVRVSTTGGWLTYRCLEGHTSGENFDQEKWENYEETPGYIELLALSTAPNRHLTSRVNSIIESRPYLKQGEEGGVYVVIP